MPLDAVDGMFAALVCSPVVAGPSEWMPLVFGGMPLKWRSIPEAEYFYSLMICMWNDVATHIDGGTYEMLLPAHDLEDGTAIYYPHDWCQGFFDGMELHEAYWWDLSRDEVMEMIRPIADVLGDHALRSNPKVRARLKDLRVIDESEYNDLCDEIVENVFQLRAYWLEHPVPLPKRKSRIVLLK